MPKTRKNDQWLTFLEEMREGEERDSNKYHVYNKAFNSLKKETKEYHDPEALIEAKFIGSAIVSQLKKLWRESGGVPAMGEIPSNLPSPAKRKRKNGTASSSNSTQPKGRGRPPRQPVYEETSDEDGDNQPAAKRRARPLHDVEDIARNQPPVLAPPKFPLGVPPHVRQEHLDLHPQIAPNPSIPQFSFHNLADSGRPQQITQAYQPFAIPRYAQPHQLENIAAPSHGAQPIPIFKFYYVDSDRRRVQSRDLAEVDIHGNTLWHKVSFLDYDVSKDHPIRRQLRLLPETRKGKRREELVEAWISDEAVEQFGLQVAPGFTKAKDLKNAESASRASFNSRIFDQIQHDAGGSALTKAAPPPGAKQQPQKDTLEDLLKAERKTKKNTIDPTRNTDLDKEWDVRRNAFVAGDKKGTVQSEGQNVAMKHSSMSMRERLERAAILRQQNSSAGIPASPAETALPSSQPMPSRLSVNPALRRTKTLSESSSNPTSSQNHPTSRNSFQSNFTQRLSNVTNDVPRASSTHIAPAPASVSSAQSAPNFKGKGKGKGKARGRVSEFAPAHPAVDEFDMDLDRQAAQRIQIAQPSRSSVSHASADLIDNVTDLTIGSAASFPTFDPVVFPADSYEIILVLDSREVKSHKHQDRDHIALELRKRGVNVEQRSLALGDVLWIAKRKWPVADAVNNECVLDYVLERKRLDDLCGSIKEGRFHEQKFRLSNTGLKVFYLIEDYDVEKNREFFGVQIDTARSSVQIVDGFILKETKKLSHTIDYLATMHQTIIEMYQHKPLHVIPPHLIKRHSYMALQKHLRQAQPTIDHFTSYTCYEALNSKSANLTTRDLLAQMLLCVKGLSAEKAAVIINAYPTIRSLWEAFREAETNETAARREEEEAASQNVKGKGRKKKIPLAKAMLCGLEASGRKHIGPVLSENVYRLMRANAYEE